MTNWPRDNLYEFKVDFCKAKFHFNKLQRNLCTMCQHSKCWYFVHCVFDYLGSKHPLKVSKHLLCQLMYDWLSQKAYILCQYGFCKVLIDMFLLFHWKIIENWFKHKCHLLSFMTNWSQLILEYQVFDINFLNLYLKFKLIKI